MVVTLLDQPLWSALRLSDRIANRDWYRMLRIGGYLPTWIILAGAVFLATSGDAGRPLRDRARIWLVPIAAALSGLTAEILKLIIGRQRPNDLGEYTFKPFLHGFIDGSNLGLPSSHAATAFGAALVVCRLWPRAGWIVIPLAVGCSLTRVFMGDHFVSDVVAAAGLGYAWSRVLVPPARRFP